jgi:SynChlorMet cassette radical SAM/SPASM protein ScmF
MPLCDARAADEFASNTPANLPDGVPPLRSFYLYLTSGCNLMCRHCWIKPHFINGKPDPKECIDPDMLFDTAREAKTLGLCGAKLTGGEPLFHPRFREIAAGLSDMELAMNMETNGVLITPELARFLKNDTKVHFISISLDDNEAAAHDAFRGVPGAFDAALRGLDALAEAGYANTQVIMSLHKGNVHKMENVVRIAADHGAASVKFNPVTDSGRGKQMTARRETLGVAELMELESFVYGELREKTRIKNCMLNMPPALRSLRTLRETRGRTGDCGVIGILGILGTGEIAMCGIGQTIPALVYGKLGDSITDIWLAHPKLQALRRELANRDNYPGVCGECLMARLCRTGCVANNYLEGERMVWAGKQCREAQELGLFPAGRKKRGYRTKAKGERQLG